jgi:hypothetical protein
MQKGEPIVVIFYPESLTDIWWKLVNKAEEAGIVAGSSPERFHLYSEYRIGQIYFESSFFPPGFPDMHFDAFIREAKLQREFVGYAMTVDRKDFISGFEPGFFGRRSGFHFYNFKTFLHHPEDPDTTR